MPDGSVGYAPMPRETCPGCGSEREWRAALGSLIVDVPAVHVPGMVYYSFCPNACVLCDICSRPLKQGELCDCMAPCPKCGIEKYRYGECLFCTTGLELPDLEDWPDGVARIPEKFS
jgi:hypothetical protein